MADLTTIGVGAAAIISIGFNVIQAFANGFSKTEKLKDKASAELVQILQTTLDTLKKEFTALQASHLENVKETARARGENETLTKILQGRDDTTLLFQKQGFVAFEIMAKQAPMMERIASTLDRLDTHLTTAAK